MRTLVHSLKFKRVVAKIFLSMANNRQTFKRKITEHLTGALREFYKATLAKKNGYSKWTVHWMTEVHGLIGSFGNVLEDPCRGFQNKCKAIDEVIELIKKDDVNFRNKAKTVIKKDFEVNELKKELDDHDSVSFWEIVEKTISEKL